MKKIRSIWKNRTEHKKVFDEIAQQLNIKKPEDWSKFTVRQIGKEKGISALLSKYYSGSLFQALQAVYPETAWNREWFPSLQRTPQGYWSTKESRKKFMDELAAKFNIKEKEDWMKLKTKDIKENGGGKLLTYYYGSMFNLLSSLYPGFRLHYFLLLEHKWERESFVRKRGFISISFYDEIDSIWKDSEYRRKFLEEIGKKLGVKEPRDWVNIPFIYVPSIKGKITSKQVIENGGSNLLIRYFNGSIFKMVSNVFSDVEWHKEWFVNIQSVPLGYWDDLNNRRAFLKNLGEKLGIKEAKDWGKIRTKQVEAMGGAGLLKFYRGSLFSALQSLFGEIEWKNEWFERLPKNFWKSEKNQRDRLEYIFKQCNLTNPQEWTKLTSEQIIEMGGSSVLSQYHGSFHLALQKLYPEITWDFQLFHKPNHFWPNPENQRKFLDSVAKSLNIQNPNQWAKVTTSQIKARGGGGLLRLPYYKGSLVRVLHRVYPEIKWEREWFKHFPNDLMLSIQSNFVKKE